MRKGRKEERREGRKERRKEGRKEIRKEGKDKRRIAYEKKGERLQQKKQYHRPNEMPNEAGNNIKI